MITQVKDAYTWGVIYEDGTYISEHDTLEGRGFAEVGDKPVKDLWIVSTDPNSSYGHRVSIPNGATPIFFRRRRIAINPTDESTTQQPTIHCIGWKRGEQAVYLFVYDDSSTLLTDNLQAV